MCLYFDLSIIYIAPYECRVTGNRAPVSPSGTAAMNFIGY